MDEINAECQRITEESEKEAKTVVANAAKDAEVIQAKAQAKVGNVVQRIVKTIRGE